MKFFCNSELLPVTLHDPRQPPAREQEEKMSCSAGQDSAAVSVKLTPGRFSLLRD